MSPPQPQCVGHGADTAEPNASGRIARRVGFRHPLGEPIVAVVDGNEPRDETQERRAGRAGASGVGHVGAGVAPGASVRVKPGNRSVAPARAFMPAPVAW